MSDVPPVSAICDVLALRALGGWLTPPLRPVVGAPAPIVGHAVPVELRAEPSGRGLGALHELLSGDLTGAVVVIAGATGVGGAIWGEIMSRAARNAGVIAVLVEGAARDREAMEAEGVAVYAVDERVVGPAGRVSVCAVNRTVCVAGVHIDPGDLVAVDSAGAVRIPGAVGGDVLADARAYAAAEDQVLEGLAVGVPLVEAYRHKRALIDRLHSAGGR